MPPTKKLPARYVQFTKKYPDVARAYEELGAAVHSSGALGPKQRAIVKFALSTGARLQGGAHSHVRKALEAGVKPAELRHVALLAIPTIGFPAAMAAMSWIDDVVDPDSKRKSGKK